MYRNKVAFLFLTLMAVISGPFKAAAQSSVAGNWQGTMKTDGARLRLILHITASPSGTLVATIDSLDQDSPGIPVSAITFDNTTLKLSVPQVQASFEGKLNRDGTEISGTWTEGNRLSLKFKRMTDSTKVVSLIPIGGDWEGKLSADGRQLNFVLHLNTTTYTRLEGTLDNVDQSLNGTRIKPITFKDNVLKFTVDSIHSSYVGKLSDDRNEIEGVWTQDHSFPLIFRRAAEPRTIP
jgi:hypothetical protein